MHRPPTRKGQVRQYITGEDNCSCPMVLYGATGVGKSVLLARVAHTAYQDLGGRNGFVVAVRAVTSSNLWSFRDGVNRLARFV
eukprot:7781160-Pyramimonas_sp.AAC.1